MLPEEFELPARAMAIYAHPDDVDFSAAGTLAAWADRGVHITYCLITSGDKGTHDPKMPAAKLAKIREQEQRDAGAVVGVKDFVFLRRHDGETEVSMRLRGEVCKAIRIHKPDAVFTFDPWRAYQTHPDHRVAGWSGLDGIIAARDHLFFPEQLKNGLVHHRVRHAFLAGSAEPNMWFDIGAYVDRKVAAITSHRSQVQDPAGMRRRILGGQGPGGAAVAGPRWGLERVEQFRHIAFP